LNKHRLSSAEEVWRAIGPSDHSFRMKAAIKRYCVEILGNQNFRFWIYSGWQTHNNLLYFF